MTTTLNLPTKLKDLINTEPSHSEASTAWTIGDILADNFYDITNSRQDDLFGYKSQQEQERRDIPAEAVLLLTEMVIGFIANINQIYIDAGSERDVTDENEELRTAIANEFAAWVNPDQYEH